MSVLQELMAMSVVRDERTYEDIHAYVTHALGMSPCIIRAEDTYLTGE